MLPVVLRYKRDFLPLSETFIYNQICSLRAFTPVVVTEDLLNAGTYPFPRLEVVRRKYWWLPRALAERSLAKQLGPIAAKYGATLVHCNFGGMAAKLVGPCRLLGLPLITSFHGDDVYSRTAREPHAYDELFRFGSLFICTSSFLRERLLKAGAPPERTVAHQAGVNLAEFPFRERTLAPGEAIRLVAVGRFVPKKGFQHLIPAFHALAAEGRPLELTIVGYGPDRARLVDLAARGPGAAKIKFRFSNESKEPRRLRDEELARAHLAVVPSCTAPNGAMESLCWTNVEAQAVGLPLVATRHDGIPEAVDEGRSADLVPENDPDALRDAIRALAARPQDWPGMGRAGRRFVEEKLEVGRNTTVLEGYYRDVLASSTHATAAAPPAPPAP